jgi:preprotein translocase subunit SecE
VHRPSKRSEKDIKNEEKGKRMNKIKAYIQDTTSELMTKVSWPTWKEVQESAIVVMIAGLIIAVLVYLMDLAFSSVLKFLYSIFR